MSKVNVQILIYPAAEGQKSEQLVLAGGQEYARCYALTPPQAILRQAGQKPQFDSADLFFSLTHSGDFWVCALADAPLGIDLQQQRECNRAAICRRFFHPREAEWLLEAGVEEFFSVWSAKESYVKFTGEGITDDFSAFSVVNQERQIRECNGAFLQPLPFADGYSLCLCTGREAHATLLLRA